MSYHDSKVCQNCSCDRGSATDPLGRGDNTASRGPVWSQGAAASRQGKKEGIGEKGGNGREGLSVDERAVKEGVERE